MDEATRRFDKEVAASLVRPPVALRPIAAAAAAGRQALLDMYAMALQPCRLYECSTLRVTPPRKHGGV
ncbi:hypothetical protein MTO96_009049 [Rhipicephalus appendiculatus]